MKYQEPESFRTALEARLRQSADGKQDLARRRRTVAFDRFLSRLAVADHNAWVLKGGAALEFRMPQLARATKDVDLALASEVDPADVLADDLAGDPFGDHFAFVVTRRRELLDNPERGPVIRLSIDALVGVRLFEKFVVDVVTASQEASPLETVQLGRVVSFAEVPLVELAVINLRTHWAEKLSAYLRRYDDRPNTRVKDLVDLVLLIEHGLMPETELHVAVSTTFKNRQQQLPSSALPSMAEEWAVPFAEMASELGLATRDAQAAHGLVEQFWRQAMAAAETTRGGEAAPETY